jgi:nucleotide-binding universal stress UspA family protein
MAPECVAPSLADFQGVSESYFGPFSEGALIRFEAEREALVQNCLERLERIQKRHFGSLTSEICVKSAGVAETIVDDAREIPADLVMMPTHGLGPLRRF